MLNNGSGKYFSIDTIRNNNVYENNAIRYESDYTTEQLVLLYQGYEVPVLWNENNNPVEWEAISDYEEEEEEYAERAAYFKNL